MDRPISEIMAKTVRTADMEDTVEKVEDDLSRLRLHAMPVVDAKGAVFGILSSVDFLHFHASKKNPKTVRAWELCTYKPVSVAASTPMKDVAKMMISKRIHHVVVTDGKDLKGIVSTLDFLEHNLKKFIT
jgi:signal-transduction protein with cAMP-binding, CBS, and nucleotidyltransferase domain